MATDVPRSMGAMNLKFYQRRPQIYYTHRRPQTRTRFGSWRWKFGVLEFGTWSWGLETGTWNLDLLDVGVRSIGIWMFEGGTFGI